MLTANKMQQVLEKHRQISKHEKPKMPQKQQRHHLTCMCLCVYVYTLLKLWQQQRVHQLIARCVFVCAMLAAVKISCGAFVSMPPKAT